MKKDELSDIALRRRLKAAGCPIPADDHSEPQRDLILEVARPELNLAYDLRRGGIEFVFTLRITNVSYARLTLEQFSASLPWASVVQWRGDPRIDSPEKTTYRLENGRDIRCEKILNCRIGETLEPGGSVDGFLLGYILFDHIPCDYIHGSKALVDLYVVDQFERQHRAEVELLIDRTETMRPVRPAGSRSTLFDGPKPERSFQKYQPGTRNQAESNDRSSDQDQAVTGPQATSTSVEFLDSVKIGRPNTDVGKP